MLNILYITYLEDIFFNGIFETQFINLFKEINQIENRRKVFLLSYIPVHHFLTGARLIIRVRKKLSEFGISLIVAPAFIRKKWLGKKFNVIFLIFFSLPVIGYIIIIKKIKIIHSRSYPATLIGLVAKKVFNKKLLFDMRGLYPEEGIMSGYWEEKSNCFKLWKEIEKILIKNSDCIVVVTKLFAEYIYSIDKDANVFVIPCCVDVNIFYRNKKYRRKLRKKYGLESKFVIVYSGSFLIWTGAELLVKTFKMIKAVLPNSFFLILTQDKVNRLKMILKEEKVLENCYLILNKKWDDIPQFLSIGDASLLVRKESIVNRVSCPVKFTEYMASGLPIIVSNNVESIVSLVKKYNTGCVIDYDNISESKKSLKCFFNSYKNYYSNCLELANDLFSLSSVANKYLRLYNNLR